MSRSFMTLAGKAVDRERAVQIPQRQSVAGDIQVWMCADRVFERIRVGH